jgi:hypothetical protein
MMTRSRGAYFQTTRCHYGLHMCIYIYVYNTFMIVYSTYTDTYAEKLLNTLTRPILGVSNCDSHLDGMVPR